MQKELMEQVKAFAKKISDATVVHQTEYDLYLGKDDNKYATNVSGNSGRLEQLQIRMDKAPDSPAAKVFSDQINKILPDLIRDLEKYAQVARTHFGDSTDYAPLIKGLQEAAKANFKPAEAVSSQPQAKPAQTAGKP